jgi:hypothetical protein
MSQPDAIGRVLRVEYNPPIERHPHLEKTDRDKQGKDHEERRDEEPHDTVELHEEGQEPQGPQAKMPKPRPRGLDISA